MICYQWRLQVLGWKHKANYSYSIGCLAHRWVGRCLQCGWQLWFLNEDCGTWVDGAVMVGNGTRRNSSTLNGGQIDKKKDDDRFRVHRKHYMKCEGVWVKEIKSFQRPAHIKEKIGSCRREKLIFPFKTGTVNCILSWILVFIRFCWFLQNYFPYLLTILSLRDFPIFKFLPYSSYPHFLL